MKKIQKGDTVQIMIGKDAGKKGEVLNVIERKDKNNNDRTYVVVKDINKVKKSQKPNPQLGIEGGIVEFEKPIDISNVMYYDKTSKAPTRVGIRLEEGKKVRYSKKSGEAI